ncbi:MAG: acyltransferase family protein [Pseudomarimonas sp.]
MNQSIATIGKRMYSLDILRGVAILLVLVRHLPPTQLSLEGWGESTVLWLTSIGHIGVDLFFVLSGFLIAGLIFTEYERHGSFRPWHFFLRRGFKIWPAYFVAYGGMTLARIAAELWKGDADRAGELASHAVCNAVFLQNYLACERWSHSWSLAVEEHFYAALALVLGWAAWRGAKRGWAGARVFSIVLPLAAAVWLIALGLRVMECFPDYLSQGARAYYQSHMRADSLMAGVACAFLFRYRSAIQQWQFSRWFVVLAASVAALIWPTLWPQGESPWFESVAFTLLWMSFSVLVLAAAKHPDCGLGARGFARLGVRAVAWMGIYSYTIYLGHSVLFGIPGFETVRQRLLGLMLEEFSVATVLWTDRAIYLGGSILLGVLLSKLIERPFLRVRDRLLPSRSKVLEKAPLESSLTSSSVSAGSR